MILVNAYVSANVTSPFYGANSARICDSTTNSCKCSTTTEQCTGETICNTDGACQGKYRNLNNFNDKPKTMIHSNIIFVINPIYFLFIHEHILLITLQQQSNPGKITNLAPGKLLLANCIHATYRECMTTTATVLFLFLKFQE